MMAPLKQPNGTATFGKTIGIEASPSLSQAKLGLEASK